MLLVYLCFLKLTFLQMAFFICPLQYNILNWIYIYVLIFLLLKKNVTISLALYRGFSFTSHHRSPHRNCPNSSNFTMILSGISSLSVWAWINKRMLEYNNNRVFWREIKGRILIIGDMPSYRKDASLCWFKLTHLEIWYAE